MKASSSRLNWLDNLRWVTVLLVLLYHVVYFFNNKGVYGGIGGFVDDPKSQPQDVVMYIVYPWFMMLLFLVAGISARYALQRQSTKSFVAVRTRKLLVPATVGLFAFQWMAGYFSIQAGGIANGISQNINTIPAAVRYVACAFAGTGPLWFVQDIWLFSILLVLIKMIDRNDCFWQWCGKSGLVALLLMGVLVFLGQHTMIMNPKPGFDGLYNLYKPVAYLIPFLMGYFVFAHQSVQELVAKYHLPLLALAVIAGVVFVVSYWGENTTSPQVLCSVLTNLYAWLMILAMLGCFKSWFDCTNTFTEYMTRTSYGIYVVHYLVVVSLGYMLKVYTQLPPWSIYAILTVAVFTISPAIYELLHRIPVVRWGVLGEK